MNERFIESCHILLGYELKPGTKGSFYQVWGQKNILPENLCLGIFAQKRTSQKDSQKKNEINGTYRKDEKGLYSSLNKGKIHSSIWGKEEYPEFYGYGIFDERYSVFDLLIIYSDNNCSNSLEIHIFRGMGKPEYLSKAFNYLRNHIKQKAPMLGALRDIK